MAAHQLFSVSVSVLVEIFSAPEHISLVHANIDLTRRIVSGYRLQHFVYEFVRPLVVNKQNVVAIEHIVILPAANTVKMSQSLNTWNQLDSELCCILVEVPDLFGGKSAAHIPEKRFAFYFIRIFRIQIKRVVS